MEQKQRKVKANPFGDQNEEELDTLPAPPQIDDLLKAAEMEAEKLRKEQEQAQNKPEAWYCDTCGREGRDVCKPRLR
jgi:hypothetical protein